MPSANLRAILDRFASQRMLVLGDVILDRYWWGESHRLSPEAPVPVVRKRSATVRPGGAANTAANLVALGASAELCGVIGQDAAGAEVQSVLAECGIASALIEDPTRPTTSKTRIVAIHQQVVRVDEEETAPLSPDLEARALAAIRARLDASHAVVVSDYAKGFLTKPLLRELIDTCVALRRPIFVDPKGLDYKQYLGCTLLKPNRLELGVLTQRNITNHAGTLEAGRLLASWMPGTAVLVTEGAEGMTVFLPDGTAEQVPSILKQVFDVTGAGDTVLATIALAVTAGAGYREALELAVRAASIVVGVVGTTAVKHSDLAAALE